MQLFVKRMTQVNRGERSLGKAGSMIRGDLKKQDEG